MCLVGEISVGDVPGWGSVRRGCAWSGKCPSDMYLVGEMFVGEVSVGKSPSGKCPSGICLTKIVFSKIYFDGKFAII